MLKFAIIGCGQIAPKHAENIIRVGKLSAVCDIVSEKANAMAKQYTAKPYYSVDELLKNEPEIDIVSVCTPNGLHAEHSIKSLQASKNVLCEKPLCITSAAAWQIIETTFHFKKKLFVVKQNRFNPGIKLLKKLLQENSFGEVYSFQVNCFWNRPQQYYTGDWKGTLFLDGGILYTQFSHFIDLIYWLFGDVDEVKAYKSNYQKRNYFEIEDTLIAILKLKNNLTGTLYCTINSYQTNKEGSITVFAEKGSAKIGGQYLNEIEWLTAENITAPELKSGKDFNNYGFYQGSMSNHHLVYDELINAFESEAHNMVAATEAVKTIEIIEKIYRAAVTVGA